MIESLNVHIYIIEFVLTVQANPKQTCMRPRHRNYVNKSSENRPSRKKKRRIHTELQFVEEDWPSSSTESAERQNASQCIEVDYALKSGSSHVVKKSEFVFENTLYGELSNGGDVIHCALIHSC